MLHRLAAPDFPFFVTPDEHRDLFKEIVEGVDPNVRPAPFAFTPDADGSQLKFINSQAKVIRLLASAGSGKTQSVANRVIQRMSGGAKAQSFLILTFDN